MEKSAAVRSRSDSSGDRMLAVLGLFTIERPQWTVEQASEPLGVSATTTYRYFKRLTKVGLISPVAGASYTLGPAIIQMDRQIQICDPMLRAARSVMTELAQQAVEGSTILLCRLFHDRVICVDQIAGRGAQAPLSYERGRPIPLFRGATSKVILAYLPLRALKSLFAQQGAAIAAAGLGANWDEFRRALGELRRAPGCITRGDLDAGRLGIAAALFDREHAILGSLSLVAPLARVDDTQATQLLSRITAGARAIERRMNHGALSAPAIPPRMKVASG